MKLTASTMLKQYRPSSVFPLLCHCLPGFDEICGKAMNFVFFVRVTLIKTANTALDNSAALKFYPRLTEGIA